MIVLWAASMYLFQQKKNYICFRKRSLHRNILQCPFSPFASPQIVFYPADFIIGNSRRQAEYQPLSQQKKNYWITAVPATFMSAVSCTYFILGEECLGQLLNKHEVVDGARKLVAYNTALAYPLPMPRMAPAPSTGTHSFRRLA